MKKQLVVMVGLVLCLMANLFTSSLMEAASAYPQIQNAGASPNRQSENRIPDYTSPPVNAALTMNTAAAQDLALAMGVNANDVVVASIGTSDPLGIGVRNSGLSYFPTQGTTFAILSTGLVSSAGEPNQSGSLSYKLESLNNSQGNDLVQLTLRLHAPNDKNCMSVDFAYYSEEFPEFVGSKYNDTFTIEFNGSNLIISSNEVVAPLNFAFDTSGSIISVNTVAGVTGNTGTTYDGVTPLLKAKQKVPPGQTITVVFSIQDLGDSVYDSTVFLDNFLWSNDNNCESGSQAKPPLLLVHGIQTVSFDGWQPKGYSCKEQPEQIRMDNSNTTLDAMPQWFTYEYEVWVAFLDSSPIHTPSLEQNGECLRRQVNYLYERSNHQKIEIIAHSMGGLVSRACLAFSDCRSKVRALYTLGSPHGGLNWEVVSKIILKIVEKSLAAHGIPIPVGDGVCAWQVGLCQMSTENMLLFNYSHPNLAGIDYNFVGGKATPFWPGRFLWLVEGGNDGIVGSRSAVGWTSATKWFIPPNWPNASLPKQYWTDEVHFGNFSGYAYYEHRADNGFAGKSQSFGCIQHRKGKISQPSYCEDPANVISAGLETNLPALSQFTKEVYGVISNDQTAIHEISVDTNQASAFILAWTNGIVQFGLQRPDGQLIDSSYAASHPSEVAYTEFAGNGEFVPYATYAFSATMPGIWHFVITGVNTGDTASAYVGFVALETDRKLDITHDTSLYRIGDTAHFTATLQDGGAGVSGAVVKVILQRADGITDTVILTEAKSGLYQAAYVIPDAPGIVAAETTAVGNDNGLSFNRQTNLVITIQSDDAQFAGTYSEQPRNDNQDLLYENLDFTVDIEAMAASEATLLTADLTAQSKLVAFTAINVSLTPGTQAITLQFDGSQIRASNLNGPYTVSRLSLIDSDLGVPAQMLENIWTTAPYNWQEFGACYTLTLVNNPSFGGNVQANPVPNCNNATQYSVDTTLTLTAKPAQGYIFTNWIVDGNGATNPIQVALDGNKTVAANFLEVTWGEPAMITMTADPLQLSADNTSLSTIVATVMDANGNVIPAQNVTFATTLGTLNSFNATTNAAGVATVALKAPSTSGKATVLAQAGTATESVQVEFIVSYQPGDCNGNQTVGASDITALALEFFDGDDNKNPGDTANGTYPGNPGCDANADAHIGASDITCIALIFFNGPGACSVSTRTAASASPVLSVATQIPATAGGQVTVPIVLQANGGDVSSLLFSLDYDETWLSFDPTDDNQDGLPDAVTFNLPAQYVRAVTFDANDTDGELDVMLASFAAQPAVLVDGTVLSVTLHTGTPSAMTEAAVSFSQAPAASFGNSKGQDVAGMTAAGSVLIAVAPDPATPNSIIYLPLISHDR